MSDLHAVFAVDHDNQKHRLTGPLSYNLAVQHWANLDNELRAGLITGTKFFAVRSIDDPDWPQYATTNGGTLSTKPVLIDLSSYVGIPREIEYRIYLDGTYLKREIKEVVKSIADYVAQGYDENDLANDVFESAASDLAYEQRLEQSDVVDTLREEVSVGDVERFFADVIYEYHRLNPPKSPDELAMENNSIVIGLRHRKPRRLPTKAERRFARFFA